MKILKKLLIISLFSFLFLVPKVFAVTNFSTTSIFTLEAWLRNNSTKTPDDYREILLSNFTFPDEQYRKSNYIIALDTASQSSTRNTIYYLSSDFYQNIAYNYNYGTPSLYFRNNNQGSYTWCYADVNYYSNGNFKNYGSWVCNTTSNWTGIMSTNYQFYILSTNYPYFTYTTPTWNTDNFSIDNGTQYIYQQSEIPLNFLNGNRFNFTVNDYFYTPVDDNICTYTSQIGALTNVKSISIRIRGSSSALDFPNKGSIKLRSTDFINTNIDFKTFVHVSVESGPSAEDPLTDFNLSYNVSSLSTSYETEYNFDYSIQYMDDIETDFDIIFTFSSNDSTIANFFKNEVLIFVGPYECDLSNVSYGYTNDNSGVTISTDTALSNWLNDSNLPDLSPFIDTSLIPAGPVDSILTLPLNIMNSLLSKLNTSSCSALVLPIPFLGGNIVLPCVNTLYSQINGLSVFLNWFSSLFSAFILYKYFINLYRWVDDTLTFRENNHFGGF